MANVLARSSSTRSVARSPTNNLLPDRSGIRRAVIVIGLHEGGYPRARPALEEEILMIYLVPVKLQGRSGCLSNSAIRFPYPGRWKLAGIT